MQLLIDVALSLIYFFLFLILCAWVWRFWKLYVNQKHLNSIDWIMLEIKLPRELVKSPYATEVAINSLLQGSGIGNWYFREIKGNLPVFASLEIASIEGIVHFYVRVQKRFRSIVESNFYAQYPGIEIMEAEDYTSMIKYEHLKRDKVGAFGSSFALGRDWELWDFEKGERMKHKMKADFLPLKTYVDYEMERNPPEEYKIDPLAQLIEFMGSMGKGEYLWYQVLLQDEGVYNGKKFSKLYVNENDHKHYSLKEMADTFKKELRIEGFSPAGKTITKEMTVDNDGNPVMKDVLSTKPTPTTKKEMELTQEDKEFLEAINKKLSKQLAVSVIRLMYLADSTKTKFNPGHIPTLLSFGKPFSWPSNSARNNLGVKTTSDPYEYPWQNFQGRRTPWRTEEFFEAYVEREGFFPHIQGRDWLDRMEDNFFWNGTMKARKLWRMIFEGIFFPFSHPHPEDITTLNLEEVATIWHLPSAAIVTPTLPRIDSAKAVAPVNLPQ